MGTLFMLLVGMLLGGAGISLAIMAHDRSRERDSLVVRCSADE